MLSRHNRNTVLRLNNPVCSIGNNQPFFLAHPHSVLAFGVDVEAVVELKEISPLFRPYSFSYHSTFSSPSRLDIQLATRYIRKTTTKIHT